jgi:hypothetical protein
VTEYHEDIANPLTGLEFEVSGNQRSVFWFWVLCKVSVFAEQGFTVSTCAGATLSCDMPYLVVKEIPI